MICGDLLSFIESVIWRYNNLYIGNTTSFFALDLNLLTIDVPQDPDPDFDDDPFEFIAKMDGEKGANCSSLKFFSFVDIGDDVGDTVIHNGDFMGIDDKEEKQLSSVSAK